MKHYKITPYKLIHIMKESTNEYYNMRIALGIECI